MKKMYSLTIKIQIKGIYVIYIKLENIFKRAVFSAIMYVIRQMLL